MAITAEQYNTIDRLKKGYSSDDIFKKAIDEKYWEWSWDKILSMYNSYTPASETTQPQEINKPEDYGTWSMLPDNIIKWVETETKTEKEDNASKPLIHTDLRTWEIKIVWSTNPTNPTNPTETNIQETTQPQEINKPEDYGTWAILPDNITKWVETETKTEKEDKKELNRFEKFSQDTWIEYSNWKFNPKSIDEAIDLYISLWKDTPINKKSIENIKATAIYDKFSQYKWASKDQLLAWLKKWDLAISWKTWDLLVKLNWWLTPEMQEAKKQFEDETKIDIVNKDNQIILWEEKKWNKVSTRDKIDMLDKEYEEKIKSLFNVTDNAYKQYKEWNDEINSLWRDIDKIDNQIDWLENTKRKTLDDIKKQYPWLDYSQQIALYNDRVKWIDDQIYALRNQRNSLVADYKYESEKVKSEYEYILNKTNQEMSFIEKMYNKERWDLINELDVENQQKKIEEERKYKEAEYRRAIADKDREAALQFAQELALIDYKDKINQKNKEQIIKLWWTAYLELDPKTWQYVYKNPQPNKTENKSSTSLNNYSNWNSWNIWNFKTIQWMRWAWAKNNNPWNVKFSPLNKDLAIWEDSQWHLIFPDLKTWYQALLNEINAKKTWNTSTWLWPDSTLYDLAKIYQEKTPETWINWINKITWYTADMKLKDLNTEKLAEWIINAETSWRVVYDKDKQDGTPLQNLTRRQKELALNDAANIISWKYNPSNDWKIPKDIKSASSYILEQRDDFEKEYPDLYWLFDKYVTTWWRSLSNEEWARLFKKALSTSWDVDINKFKQITRNLAIKDMWKEWEALMKLKSHLNKLDRIDKLIDKVDPNKWKQLNQDMWRKIWKSSWKDLDMLRQKLWTELVNFVRETSWLAVTDNERKYLESLMPNVWMDRDLAKNMLESFREEIKKWRIDITKAYLWDWEKWEKMFNDLFPEFKEYEQEKLDFGWLDFWNSNSIVNEQNLDNYNNYFQ